MAPQRRGAVAAPSRDPTQQATYLSRSMATVTSHVTVSWHQVPDLSDESRTADLYVNR
jgi:hypothetical protein